MARIRSVHPGLFTDEQFMALALAAKVAWIGIWTEADDAGVFAWQPLTLKARLLPAENVDMAGILEELERVGLVRSFEQEGKRFGVAKAFGKWQRPKKPKYRYPLPHDLYPYAAYSAGSSAPVPHQSGTSGGVPAQREEEGGRREEEGERDEAARPGRAGQQLVEAWCLTIADFDYTKVARPDLSHAEVLDEARRFQDWAKDKGIRGTKALSVRWRTWIKDASVKKTPKKAGQSLPPDTNSVEQWRARVLPYKPGDKYWRRSDLGPAPDEPGCRAPAAVLDEWRANQSVAAST